MNRHGCIAHTASLILLLFTAVVPAAAGIPGVRVIGSDARMIELEITPVATITRLTGGEVLPHIAGAAISNPAASGAPMQMSIAIPLALPAPAGNQLEILAVEYDTLLHGRIAPVPTRHSDSLGSGQIVYKVDPAAYARPVAAGPVAQLHYSGVARDLHVGSIIIDPYRFNVTTSTIQFLKSIRVRLRYAVPQTMPGQREVVSELTRGLFLNSVAAANWGVLTPSRPLFARHSAMSAARGWMRLQVKEEGMYVLTADDFNRAGIDLGSVDPARIAIYGGDGGDLPESQIAGRQNAMHQIPAIIERDGNGRAHRVLFYGTGPVRWQFDAESGAPIHQLSPYVAASSYIVTVDGEPSRDFPVQQQPAGASEIITSARASVAHDEEKINLIATDYVSGGGRTWVETEFLAGGGETDTRIFTTPLPGLDRTSTVTYRVRVSHSGHNSCEGCTDGAGSFTLAQDQQPLGGEPITIPGLDHEHDNGIASAVSRLFTGTGGAIPADNRSLLRISYQPQLQSKGHLDYYEIHYTRHLAVDGGDNGHIVFWSAAGTGVGEYHVAGFDGDDLIGFDITDAANPIRLLPVSTGGGTFIFRDQRGTDRRYFITRIGAAHRVDDAAKAVFSDLRSRMLNADILVITHPDLSDAAEKYVNYRNAQGRYRAAFVTTDEIYTEFSHGNADPTALRDYISFAFFNWQVRPGYVLLLGDGSYDYRTITSKQKQYVPSYQIDDRGYFTYSYIYSSTFDDYFVRVNGDPQVEDDRIIDMAIGRIPIQTEEEMDVVLNKLRVYESEASKGRWRQTVILGADDAKGYSENFIEQSDSVWRSLPSWIEPKKIYLSAYPTVPAATSTKPAAAQNLLDFVNRGAVITNWVGHGNPDVWAHETILQQDQFIPKLTNDSTLTYVTAVTCNFGHFDNPNKVSGAEHFLLHPGGGAIAVMTAARAVWIDRNREFMYRYMHNLFVRDPSSRRLPTIGKAMMATKAVLHDDNAEKYMIFGDPALMLNLPTEAVRINTINEVDVAKDTVTVAALSWVTVKGEILDQSGGLRTDFNGTAAVTLFDADRRNSITDYWILKNGGIASMNQSMLFYGGSLGTRTAPVANGRFTALLRIPKDISYDSATARLHVYAWNDREDAAGATAGIRVYGSDTATVTDHSGPDLHIYLDDRSFRSGDMVTRTPLLIVEVADTSGINTSSAGIGHRLEAWIDDGTMPIDLNDNYLASPTEFGRGSVERRLLDLKPGEHHVRVRGWDIFNNPSEGEAWFRIAEGGDSTLAVVEVANYPNPMSRETDFTFRHNQTRPIDIDVAIFTPAGRKIRQLESRGATDRFPRLHWDGTDADGHPVANGTYLYRLRVRRAGDDSGSAFEVVEVVAVVR